ncbi:hypothetical protein [Paenibacillus agilis]|uniref:Uncharacterized protein n=1 Tax=Paenibacillus agilis TaxID=3020863 RepID=A0A559IDH3_9BACL|nr:hypothetical protein [Paenibacillus agilis]TVX85580.1 hypothetical protein FPZ44_24810 [Paenibacillus agilis]
MKSPDSNSKDKGIVTPFNGPLIKKGDGIVIGEISGESAYSNTKSQSNHNVVTFGQLGYGKKYRSGEELRKEWEQHG